jgi:mitogen-activated protein kinase 1/3
VSGTTFNIHPKYKLIKPIGTGSYGVVISAQNVEDPSQKVAVKKVPRAFGDEVDAKRILREIRLLRHFDHENIIKILDIEPPPSLAEFDDVYIISDLMETDLHRVIYSRQNLTDDHIQYFLYQMLCALKYIHSAGVLHRDLKPSNILLNADCHLKICDFGLARGVMPDTNKDLTEYVVTRWYRAPEIMLSCQDYKSAIDVWSVGCIFAEMLGRKPLFPGNDFIHQLNLINEVVGTPVEEDLDFITNVKARRFMAQQQKCERVSFASLFRKANADAIDLLEKMLVFNPDDRITVEQALEHPYLESLHEPLDEPTCANPFDFSFENGELKKPQLQRLIFEDCCYFHPEARLEEQERQLKRRQAMNGK